MAQIFRPGANGIAQFVLWGGLVATLVALLVASFLPRTAWSTYMNRAPDQPVPFSHEHHVGQLGIDCRYCHNGVETSAAAGLPATEVCMTCHSQIWTNAKMLAPVRDSLAEGKPLRWQRVNRVGDYVYFNHAIHVNKGVACVTCHGQIDKMPLMLKAHKLTMGWCLDCHANPEPNLRPLNAVFLPEWTPPDDIDALRRKLVQTLSIHPDTMTDCYVCHR